jgi:hypothetical protein
MSQREKKLKKKSRAPLSYYATTRLTKQSKRLNRQYSVVVVALISGYHTTSATSGPEKV